MRRHTRAVATVVTAAVFLGLIPGAWASGGNTPPDCVAQTVDKFGNPVGIPGGGPEMSGTVAIQVTAGSLAAFKNTGVGTAEVTLSLKFRNQPGGPIFVRGTIPVSAILGVPNSESVICSILSKVNGLGDEILAAFGLPGTKQLKICFSNPTSSPDKFNCLSLSSFDYDGQTGFGLGNLDRIFVVD